MLEESGVASAAVRPGALVALLPVANRPLAVLALDTLQRSGADEVAFVTRSARLAELERALEASGVSLTAVTLIADDESHSLADAIRAVGDFLGGDRFIVHRANGIWTGSCEPLRRALAHPGQDVRLFKQALSRRVPPVAGWTRSASGPDRCDYELIGVHVLGPESAELVETPRACDVDDRAAVVHGQWVACAGAVEDVVAANRAALDELTQDEDLPGCSDCRIDGRVRVHPSAQVSRSLLRGPVVVGAGALVESACLGPFTAVGAGAVVENSDVAESVLCEGAVVRNVGTRIESSVVGPGASVCGEFRLPKSLRLALGAHGTVTVS